MALLSGSLSIAKRAEKLFISISDGVPAISLGNSLCCCCAILLTLGLRHQQRLLHLLCQRCVGERNRNAASNLTVLRRVEKQRKGATPHRLDQSGMGSSNLRRVYVSEAVRLKLPISAAINSARKDDSL